MNYLRLFLLLIAAQSALFAQTDSVKKKFKPYGLIDAAPVAINKDDFKPQINITIQTADAITNLPVNAKIDYYTIGDSIVSTKRGTAVSLIINPDEKIIVISNAPGYIWQTQIFDAPESDSSYVLKLIRIKKGDVVTKHTFDFNPQGAKFESYFYPDLLGLQEFLKLNPSVKIQMIACPKWKEEVHGRLMQKSDKKRFRLKSCRNQKHANCESVTIKVLSN